MAKPTPLAIGEERKLDQCYFYHFGLDISDQVNSFEMNMSFMDTNISLSMMFRTRDQYSFYNKLNSFFTPSRLVVHNKSILHRFQLYTQCVSTNGIPDDWIEVEYDFMAQADQKNDVRDPTKNLKMEDVFYFDEIPNIKYWGYKTRNQLFNEHGCDFYKMHNRILYARTRPKNFTVQQWRSLRNFVHAQTGPK